MVRVGATGQECLDHASLVLEHRPSERGLQPANEGSALVPEGLTGRRRWVGAYLLAVVEPVWVRAVRQEQRHALGVAVVRGKHQLHTKPRMLRQLFATPERDRRRFARACARLREPGRLTNVSPLSFVKLAGSPAASGALNASQSPLLAKSKNWPKGRG